MRMWNERIDEGLGLGAVLYWKDVLEPVFNFETVEKDEGGRYVLCGFERQVLVIEPVDNDQVFAQIRAGEKRR